MLKEVLTDVPGKPGRFWDRHTTFVGPDRPPRWLVRGLGERWAGNLASSVAALRLFVRRHRARGLVTSAGACGLLLALLQRLCPWGRRPHVLVDCNWYQAPGRLSHWLKGLRLRLASPAVHRFVVWASHEVEDYARAFGLPREKLLYVPFHTTLDDYTFEVRDEGYVFAGGNYDRDYRTLVEAIRPLTTMALWIATTRPEQLATTTLPGHVRVEGTTPADFRQAMAGARVIVVPMAAGLLHSGGQQTCLNAMFLGKPTIAVGRKWAVDFIEDGVNGLIVDYEDVPGLRRALQWVHDNPSRARQMAERGRETARRCTTQATMQAIYELVELRKESECHDGTDDRSVREPACRG